MPILLMAIRLLFPFGSTADARIPSKVSVLVIALAMLGSFQHYYFNAFMTHNSRTHETFLSGPTEPKVEALRQIGDLRDPARPAVVLTDNWWLYWPLQYLSQNIAGLRVALVGHNVDWRFPAGAGWRYDAGTADQ